MRILVGTFDTAGLINPYANGFRNLGHEVTTVVRHKNRFYPDNKFDIEADSDEILSYEVVADLIENHDLFLFQWAGESLMPDNRDLRIIKKYNKKIVQIFNGDDVRHQSAYKQWCGIDLTVLSKFYAQDPLERPLKNIRTAEYFADIIFSLPNQSSLAVRPYMHSILPVDLSKFKCNIPEREVPLIVHAPSSEDVKGTKVILNALSKLKNDGCQFDLKLLKETSNQEVLQNLYNADIAIDQLYILLYGVFPLEAMASGCAVATIDHKNNIRESFPDDRPIYHIDEQNIYEKLKLLITDKSLRLKLARQGRTFVEKYHDHTKVAKRILDAVNCENLVYDYYPSFFIEKYTKPEKTQIPDVLKDMTLIILQKSGLPEHADIQQLADRGLIPQKFTGKIKRWKHEPSTLSINITNMEKKTNTRVDEVEFSICIFTYNRAHLLEKSIHSAVNQYYQNYEIIIIDDGSTDNTAEVVRKLLNSRIRYIKKEHGGIADARNRAVSESRGKYLFWLADDDTIESDTLQIYSEYITKYPEVDIFYCCVKVINKNGETERVITPKDWINNREEMLSSLLVGTPIPDGGSAVRKKVYSEIGTYDTSFMRAVDFEFWSRVVLSRKYEFKLVDKVLYTYYIHQNNITGILSDKTDYSFEAKIIRNILGAYPIRQFYPELSWTDENKALAEAYFLTSLKFLSFKDIDTAKDYFRRSTECDPLILDKNRIITEFFSNTESEANVISQKNIDSQLLLIEKLINKNDLVKAKSLLSELLLIRPDDLEMLNNLSVIEIMSGNYSTAIELLEKIITMDPGNQIAFGNLNYLNHLITKNNS